MRKDTLSAFFTLLLTSVLLGGNQSTNHQIKKTNLTPRRYKPERKRQPKPRSPGPSNNYCR